MCGFLLLIKRKWEIPMGQTAEVNPIARQRFTHFRCMCCVKSRMCFHRVLPSNCFATACDFQRRNEHVGEKVVIGGSALRGGHNGKLHLFNGSQTAEQLKRWPSQVIRAEYANTVNTNGMVKKRF